MAKTFQDPILLKAKEHFHGAANLGELFSSILQAED